MREPFEALVARCGREHGRAGALRELDRGEADAARAGLDQHGLAGGQVTELEEAVVGGAERDRHARDARRCRRRRGSATSRSRDDDELRVRAGQHRRDDALTDVPVRDAVADLADRARALVADDVRCRR